MIDLGILDGDYVVIQKAEEARDGSIVVALVDKEEATLKRIFYHDTGFVELRPENSGMESQFYPEEMVKVQGRLVGLFRSYA